MAVSAKMLRLFLRSSGAPPAVLEAFDLFQTQDFTEFGFQPMATTDPMFERIGMTDESVRKGIWLQAKGKSSRVVAAIFCEGVNDAFLEKLQTLGLPAVADSRG